MPTSRTIPKLRCPALISASVAVLLIAVVAPAAQARPKVSLESSRNVSTTSPWHGLNCLTPNPLITGTPKAAEPAIAVNPLNPLEQSTAWIDEDSGPNDAAFTEDGGRTWHKSPPVGIDPCTGLVNTDPSRYHEGSADPWLAYGVDGSLYFENMPFTNFFTHPEGYTQRVAISRAPNTSDWSLPAYTPNPLMADDKPEVVTDVSNPNYVYTISRNAGFGEPIGDRADGQFLFNRSTDGGQTFTQTVLADAHNNSAFFGTPQLVQLADGTLVATTTFPSSIGGGTRSFRSTDRGLTWSTPGSPQPAGGTDGLADKVCGYDVEFGSRNGQYAVLGGRTILALSVDNAGDGTTISLLRSTDAGGTWMKSAVYHAHLPVGLASLATDKEGRIGIVFDQADPSNVNCSSTPPTIPVRTEFVVSGDHGKTWTTPVRIGPPWWNIAAAGVTPFFNGWWVGDYSQVAAVPGRGFAVAVVQGVPLVPDGDAAQVNAPQSSIVSEFAVRGSGAAKH